MKLSPSLIAGVSVAVLLCIGLVYLNSELNGTERDLKQEKDANAALDARVGSLQLTIDGLTKKSKQSEATQGSLQSLAKSLESGDMDLAVKSLKIVAGGKSLVVLGANADQGGIINVASTDGTSTAEISAITGASKIGFKSVAAAGPAQVSHIATFGADGYYLQRGPTDDEASRTDGAGLRVADAGTTFFMSQNGAGNISIKTSSRDEKAKLSIWEEGDLKKLISLSLGMKDDGPSVAVTGAPSGGTLTLVPDRLALLGKDGANTLVAAADENGGFLIANDAAGNRRAIITAGSDGRGSLSVYGNKRSNTFLPVFDLQQTDSSQK
jgi:hypothetical protein